MRFLKFPLFSCVALLSVFGVNAFGASNSLVISQVYGGGGNSGATLKNDFIEILNISGSAISLNGYSVQYASSTGNFSSSLLTALPNVTLQPGHYFLIQEAAGSGGTVNLPTPDATGSINMSATTGKVALVNGTSAIASCTAANVVDLIGYGSGVSCSETSAAPGLSNTTADLRAGNGCTDTDNNGVDFTAGAPNPRNSSTAAAACSGTPATLTITTTSLPPATVNNIYSATLAASGGSGTRSWSAANLPNNLSVNASTGVLSGVPISTGTTTVTFMVSDSTASVSAQVDLVVNPVPPCSPVTIGSVQGPGDATPIAGRTVTVEGIVTGLRTNGFFVQDSGDGNAATSDGIFVFTSSAPSGNAVVGNLVCVTGVAAEFDGQTELDSPAFFAVSSGNPLPAPHVLTTSDLNPAGPIDQLEKYSGMRVTIPSLTVSGPTEGTVDEVHANATSNGTFYGVISGTPRPFREPGIALTDTLPPGTPPGVPRWDTNPEVIEIFGRGQVGATPIDVTTSAIVTNLTGIMSYFPSAYEILPDPGSGTVSGNITYTAVPDKTSSEITIATTNLQHFYNTGQDPNRPPGASSTNVDPTAFANRVKKLSLGYRDVLKLPDVIGVEEMLNLATLQTVAAQINADALAESGVNPGYTAYLVEGNDISNINVGFLVKSNITVVDVTQYGKDDTITNPTSGSVSPLNDRPPLVLRARAALPGSNNSVAFTVIVNHLRSLDSIDDPSSGPFVRLKRQLQSEFLANLIQSRQAADPNEKIIAIGDFNAYQFNDGYVDVAGTVKGTPAPASQVVLASNPITNPVLTALVDLEDSSQQYSYDFSGSAQEIDQYLLNPPALSIFSRVATARLNADFPEAYRGDFSRPERVSDHDWVVGYFTLPPASAPSFTDVTQSVSITSTGFSFNRVTKQYTGTLTITNTSGSPLSAPLQLVVSNLTSGDVLANATGAGAQGPYITAVQSGSLAPGAAVQVTLRITGPQSASPTFTALVFSGTF
ncbi:MAG TPA: lamin tail domain-containing protein [Verrucomicrobiae bacterium]|nr:lamin tail domain-containing protein [Verrucomicrobiae bacterium]